MVWQKRILYVAAAWNVLGGLSALADPARHFAQFYYSALVLTDPLQAFFYRAVWVNVIAWGVAYALAARYAQARLPVLAAGGAGKIAYFGVCLALFLRGTGNNMLLATGVVDLLFAGFFFYVLWRPKT